MIAAIASLPIRRPLHPLASELLRPMTDLDATDRAICEAIAKHGQMNRDEIAAKIGSSASRVHPRVQGLMDRGILRGTSCRPKTGRMRPMLHYSLIGCAP